MGWPLTLAARGGSAVGEGGAAVALGSGGVVATFSDTGVAEGAEGEAVVDAQAIEKMKTNNNPIRGANPPGLFEKSM